MLVRPFVPKTDLPELEAWATGWKYFGVEYVSKTGAIVPGLAVAFLVRTDVDFALIEPLITNPNAPALQRARAAEAVVEHLVQKAHELGFQKVVGIISKRSVQKWTRRLGFRLHVPEAAIVVR